MPYDLTKQERDALQEYVDVISTYGRLVDKSNNELDYVILTGRRRLLDKHGVLWRLYPKGSGKDPANPAASGSPWRGNMVEMWNGKWRRVRQPDGTHKYAKCLVPVSLESHVNGHPGISTIDWYKTQKGYKHPFDMPASPSGLDIKAIEHRQTVIHEAVYAKMAAEGLKKAEQLATEADPAAAPKPQRRQPRRTGKRSSQRAAG